MYRKPDQSWYTTSLFSVFEDLGKDGISQSDIDKAVNILYDSFSNNRDIAISNHKMELSGFYTRFNKTWGQPIKNLEFYILLHQHTGQFFKRYIFVANKDINERQLTALLRIHARAVKISFEIHNLIKAGFASGAISRWRPLYELAISSLFISQKGEETAERFLKFPVRESLREARIYREHYNKLNFEPIEDSQIETLEEQLSDLTDQYGDSFNSHWGWAEADLSSDASRKTLAEEVGIEEYEPFFSFSSNAVHGGPKGIAYQLGLQDIQRELFLVGPTNSGFTDPAQLTCIMLDNITRGLLNIDDEIVWEVIMEALVELRENVISSFVSTQEFIDLMTALNRYES